MKEERSGEVAEEATAVAGLEAGDCDVANERRGANWEEGAAPGIIEGGMLNTYDTGEAVGPPSVVINASDDAEEAPNTACCEGGTAGKVSGNMFTWEASKTAPHGASPASALPSAPSSSGPSSPPSDTRRVFGFFFLTLRFGFSEGRRGASRRPGSTTRAGAADGNAEEEVGGDGGRELVGRMEGGGDEGREAAGRTEEAGDEMTEEEGEEEKEGA
jgi:hypothetical protein